MMTPTPPTTTGKPARVRLNTRQAQIYSALLSEGRHSLVIARAIAKDNGLVVTEMNRHIEEIGRMQEELSRATGDRGWRAE